MDYSAIIVYAQVGMNNSFEGMNLSAQQLLRGLSASCLRKQKLDEARHLSVTTVVGMGNL